MSRHFTRFSVVAIASFLLLLSAALPTGPMAAKSPVVVKGYQVDGNQVAVTLTNHGSSHRHGQLVLLVSLDDGSAEQVVVAFSLNGGSTGTYMTSMDSDVTGATEHSIVEGNDPV